jgi:hypothetical protein
LRNGRRNFAQSPATRNYSHSTVSGNPVAVAQSKAPANAKHAGIATLASGDCGGSRLVGHAAPPTEPPIRVIRIYNPLRITVAKEKPRPF